MIKILTVGDIHSSDRNPMSRTDDYCEAIFNKLEQIYNIAVEQKVQAVVLLGDIFHIKSPTRNSFKIVYRMVKYLKQFKNAGIQVILLVGNHDLSFGDITTLAKQPIGILTELDFVNNYCYLAEDDFTVHIDGFNYSNSPISEQLTVLNSLEKTTTYKMVCVHMDIFESGRIFNQIGIKIDEVTNKDIDVLVNGHIHYPTIIEKNKSGIIYVQPGSICRESADEANLERDINVVMLGFSKEGIKSMTIKLDVKPANEIFDLSLRVNNKELDRKVEHFVDTLKDFSNKDGSSTNLKEYLETMEIDNNIKSLVKSYLDGDGLPVESL